MTTPVSLSFAAASAAAATAEAIAAFSGRLVVFASGTGPLDTMARRVNRLMRGGLDRVIASDAYGKLAAGEGIDLAYPVGLAAEAVHLVKLPRRPTLAEARKAGAAIGKLIGAAPALILAGSLPQVAELAYGLSLRRYEFTDRKTGEKPAVGSVSIVVADPAAAAAAFAPHLARTGGVFFTRDLVSEPANVLTTQEFANRLQALASLGLQVEVLEEADMAKLGMGALLGVGQGSDSPSKLVVMQWHGGKPGEKPFALIGKGVVFDTGGISIKGAAGMEEMTMDMGGAGVVAGTMRALAARKARANVVGLVGIVENMPDGRAQRPGDIVTSMKGDTIEVINTDAEGRLVLADVLWYAQDRFQPTGMIDLATLTGAIIVALGHENTGVFSNDDALCDAFLKAAKAEGEGAWRMPLGEAYDKMLKSNIADMKNIGGRDGGAITAAQFLQRFVKKGTPWIHLDIAGTALTKADTAFAPKGATGWGVMALDRLIADRFES